MQTLGTHGVLKASKVNDELSRIVEEILVRGFSVAPPVIEATAVASLCGRLDAVYQCQQDEVGGESVLESIKDADVVRCPLAYEDDFLKLAQHELIVGVARQLLGENIVLLMQNGIINRAERCQAQTRWHRDLSYQHWVSSSPLAVSALVCLDDFTDEAGGTVFLPASHKFPAFPSIELVDRLQTGVEAPSGSIVFFNSMVFHRAGVNRSNQLRRGVNHVIGVPILGQQVDIPAILAREAPTDPLLAGYLGYRWNPISEIKNWRLRKLAERTAVTRRG